MQKWGSRLARILASSLVLVLVAVPASAAGFGIFEQGTKAMGMAGAFTAQADDPSALFHNVGGIAFQRQSAFSLGATLISLGDSEFRGSAPFPGPNARGEQASNLVTPAHIYYVHPFGSSWTFGIGFNNPFGLVTEWDKPDTFPGRFLSTKADLKTYDLSPSLGWQVTPNFGLGFGVIARFAEVELDRRAAQLNPFLQRPSEVAKVNLKSDLDNGIGWQVGMLHRVTNSFSWGLSYRSKVEVDFGGDARLTQVATGTPFDPLVAAALPFNRNLPIETSVEFPDMASFGVAFAFSANTLVELDANWTGWSSFDEVAIVFPDNPTLSNTLNEDWEDVYNYRIGFRWNASSASQWRLGYVYDETPQPDETLSPLLPDADRDGITVGFGLTRPSGFKLDFALMYLDFGSRTTTTNENNFNGTYESTAWLAGLTATW